MVEQYIICWDVVEFIPKVVLRLYEPPCMAMDYWLILV